MKAANLTAKVTGMKFNAVRVLAAATLAGAVLMAAVPAAQAQRFVRFGGPRVFVGVAPVVVAAPPVGIYAGPPVVYGGYGYAHYDWRARRDFRRR
jgi:hypothetical protein